MSRDYQQLYFDSMLQSMEHDMLRERLAFLIGRENLGNFKHIVYEREPSGQLSFYKYLKP